MKVYRSFPPNPQLYTVHVDRQLTREMKERFRAGMLEVPAWLNPLLALPGIQEVDLLRHYVRIRKDKGVSWCDLQGDVDGILQATWGEWEDVVPEDTEERWECPLPQPFVQEGIAAYEGVEAAQSHPLAKSLFALDGVVLVRMANGQLMIRRGLVFSWSILLPQIELILQESSTSC